MKTSGPIILIEDDEDDVEIFKKIIDDLKIENEILCFEDTKSAYEREGVRKKCRKSDYSYPDPKGNNRIFSGPTNLKTSIFNLNENINSRLN